MKKILVILGHPDSESFSGALADAYAEGARSGGAEVRCLRLGEFEFDPVLSGKGRHEPPAETDLVTSQESLTWADHVVFAYPIWWATPPALLKGFIDRVLLPGFAYQSSGEKNKMAEPLLGGRTAHLLITMDSPSWYYRWFTGRPNHKMMKRGVLHFCGIKPVRISEYTPIKTSSEEQRTRWLADARRKGLLLQ